MDNWLVLIIGGVIILLLLYMIFVDARKQEERDTAPVRMWPKPAPGSHLDWDAVKFMRLSHLCPFCHAPLVFQNGDVFCSNHPACNSQFDMVDGSYLGPIPEDRFKWR